MQIKLSDGRRLDIEVKKKKVKRVTLRIYPDGTARISAPYSASGKMIKEFVESKKDWIEKCLAQSEKKRQRDADTIRLLGVDYQWKQIDTGRDEVTITDTYIAVSSRTGEGHKKILSDWWRQEAESYYNNLTDRWMERLQNENIKRPRIRVRKMKTLWGSCTHAKGDIRFNFYLLCTPPQCIDYVVLHEMAHLLYPNHGEQFKAFLSRYMPDWKERRKKLRRENAAEPW